MKLLKVHEDLELRQRRGQQLSVAAEDVSSDRLNDYVVPFYAVCHLHPVVPFGSHDISRLDKHAEGDDGHQHTDDTVAWHDFLVVEFAHVVICPPRVLLFYKEVHWESSAHCPYCFSTVR